ncbi:uncharacterized protein LODBEIA_P24490 [Lodderomyces beijingensis]|uniref:Cullin family profile domain-containing protein n=1 Tax=Lodderomyces beijingensis TaxID=1775926 RepID=A0ABP0ZLZ9_9ASCO
MPRPFGDILDLGAFSREPPLAAERNLSHLITSPASVSKDRKGSHSQPVNVKKRKRANEENNSIGIHHAEPPTPEEVQRRLDEAKETLYGVMDRILDGQPLGYCYGYLYQLVERVCKFKHAEMKNVATVLFDKIDGCFEGTTRHELCEPLEAAVVSMKGNYSDKDEECVRFCREFVARWHLWRGRFTLLSQVFAAIDRGYLSLHHTKQRIQVYVLEEFRNVMHVENYELSGSVLDLMEAYKELQRLHYANKFNDASIVAEDIESVYRDFITVLTQLIPSVIRPAGKKSLSRLEQDVQNGILEQVGANMPYIYKNYNLGQIFLLMDQEIKFYSQCDLSPQFTSSLFSHMNWKIIFAEYSQFEQIVRGQFAEILASPKTMKMLLRVCLDVEVSHGLEGTRNLKHLWIEHCKGVLQQGIEDYRMHKVDTEEFPSFIHYGVDIFNTFEKFNGDYFKDKKLFDGSLRTALEEAVNAPGCNVFVIQSLCKFCDTYFKSKFKSYSRLKSGTQFSDIREQALLIFKSLKNKDDFLAAHRKETSRRLILGKSPRFEEEYALVKEFVALSVETETSQGLLSMLEEIEQSNKLKREFWHEKGDIIEFSPLVLEKKSWPDIPSDDKVDIKLPLQLEDILNRFDDFYRTEDRRNRNKLLDWTNYKLHQLTITGNFASGPVEISGNLLQAVVILMFCDQSTYDLDQLSSKVNMDVKLLQAVLNTMNSGKCKILTQRNNKISYNSQFKATMSKIKLAMIKEQQPVRGSGANSGANSGPNSREKSLETEVAEIVQQNRSEEYRSVLVKIMKQEKSLAVADLLNKAIDILQMRRPVSIPDLQSSVDELIKSEYLHRVEGQIKYVP